jgi:hypothetical protein
MTKPDYYIDQSVGEQDLVNGLSSSMDEDDLVLIDDQDMPEHVNDDVVAAPAPPGGVRPTCSARSGERAGACWRGGYVRGGGG